MKKILGITALTLALGVPLAHAEQRAIDKVSTRDAVAEIARSSAEIAEATAPVRTRADLAKHLTQTAESPLLRLPAESRKKFLKSIVFTKHGVASYSYVALSGLSVTDAYNILALFGQQRYVHLVPGLRASSTAEGSMLFVATALGGGGENGTEDPPIEDSSCVVNGPSSWCEPLYGSMCNANCK